MSGLVLAIDPGPVESGFAIVDLADCRPVRIGKVANEELLEWCETGWGLDDVQHVAIERIASYGMPVGEDVFHTCFWIGRFQHAVRWAPTCELVKRQPVKVHFCHSGKAKDANVIQALIDRFAPHVRNKGKGTKSEPGWFYGFAGDIWQAYAVGVYYRDHLATGRAQQAVLQEA